jgi:glucose-6-phosphate isomerase
VTGGLGEQFVAWEYAVAVSGRLLGIDPFDQPDVESAKKAARGLLDEQPEAGRPIFVEGAVEVYATPGWFNGPRDLASAVEALLVTVPTRGYLSVMAYLDRIRDAELARVRGPLAARVHRPVTFGWGPRFLHSTGQFHKGGPPIGSFLQVTGLVAQDLEIPDRPFTFGTLITAQAAGDAKVLADHGRPVLRLHLTSFDGLAQIQKVLT